MQAHFTKACSFRVQPAIQPRHQPYYASKLNGLLRSKPRMHTRVRCVAPSSFPSPLPRSRSPDPALKTGALTIAQAYVGQFSPPVELCQLFLLGSSPASSCRHSPAILRCRAILLRHLPKREREAGRVGRCAEPVAVLCQPLAQLLRRQDERPDGRE